MPTQSLSARLCVLACALSAALASAAASAQITQPNGVVVPSDPGCRSNMPTGLLAVFACICDRPGVCNIGVPCTSPTSCDPAMNAMCESRMYHAYNDNTCIPSLHDGLDPRTDARVTPETFSPTCGLTFTVESRGTAIFQSAFGWYNATGTRPDPSDLHVMLDCTRRPGDHVVLDVRRDPAYHGGPVGFFLLTPESHTASGTCAGGDCCATVDRLARGEGYVYYSEPALNPDHMPAGSYVHLLVYDSHVWDRKFYFAWEDTFGTANNDFTDLVTSVQGVECAGGGADCDTGRPGACARGVTRCSGGTLSCIASFNGAPERCDGLDNDCNGMIDDNVVCPVAGEVCHQGACVPHCLPGDEFACPLVYDICEESTHLCVDPACLTVTCPAGQTCRAGTCTSECSGIVCPHGLDCVLDHCVDPCDGVTCDTGSVCRRGVCVPGCNQCNGVVCTGSATCDDASGRCLDPSCPGGCAAGTYCSAGTCHDACEGAVCPRSETCTAGRCVPVQRGMDGGGPGTDAGGSHDSGGDGGSWTVPPRRGCGCTVPGGRSGTGGSLAAFFALAMVVRRRSRHA